MSRQSEREAQARQAARAADAHNRLASAVERLNVTMRREPERIGSRRAGLRRLPFDVYCEAVPGLASQFSVRVPGAFWAEESRPASERAVAVISCPCGAQPESEAGCPTHCEGCERVYVYDGGHVHVANSPVKTSPPVSA